MLNSLELQSWTLLLLSKSATISVNQRHLRSIQILFFPLYLRSLLIPSAGEKFVEQIAVEHVEDFVELFFAGDDDVGELFGGFDEGLMGRFDCFQILVEDAFHVASAFQDIALQTSREADVGIGIEEDLEVGDVQQIAVVESEDAFQDHDFGAGDAELALGAAVGGEIVVRNVDRFAGQHQLQVMDQVFLVDGVRVIEIYFRALFLAQVGEVAIVVVMGEDDSFEAGDAAPDRFGDGGLAAASTSADQDQMGFMGHGASL